MFDLGLESLDYWKHIFGSSDWVVGLVLWSVVTAHLRGSLGVSVATYMVGFLAVWVHDNDAVG